MADAVSPRIQDDLFAAVNHEWLETTDIPDDQPGYGTFAVLRDNAEEAVRDLIEQAASASDPDAATQRVGDMYASFMDRDTANAKGIEAIREDLDAIDAAADLSDFLAVTARLGREGKGNLLSIGIEADFKDTNTYMVYFDQAGIGLPDEKYYTEDQYESVREEYLKHLERVFSAMGEEHPDSLAREVLQLESQFAATHMDNVTRRDPNAIYNPMSRAEVEAATPWVPGFAEQVGIPVQHLETVVVESPGYLQGLPGIVSEDNLATLKAWLKASVFHDRAAYLSDELSKLNFDFYGTILGGTPQQRDLWKRGVGLVEATLGEELGKLYVAQYFPPSHKERMDALVASLLDAYQESIANLEWMSPDTRKAGLEKLAKFRPKIGFPSKWKDYSALEVSPDDLIGNVDRSAVVELERSIARLEGPVDKELWYMTPQTVNAYYHPLHNEIAFPAAILQPPFFDMQASDAENFGAIGAVIGHEIGHGFDDSGSQFDGDGSLRNWWSDEDRSRFEELTANLVGQFNELSPDNVPDQKVNGELTLGENIGDLGGITIALKAFKNSFAGSGAPSDEDIRDFFRSYGTIWRGKFRDQEARRRLTIDPHSPNKFRSNQIAKNVDEFHDVFDTKESDGMWLAPDERVKIWF